MQAQSAIVIFKRLEEERKSHRRDDDDIENPDNPISDAHPRDNQK
jgi:hypothetical protein